MGKEKNFRRNLNYCPSLTRLSSSLTSGRGLAQPQIYGKSALSEVSDFLPQLKILLDQVDEAVGDFDECILLRPDSALAQAQKCFALVSCGT